jgi:hypothetical protein
MSLRVTKNWKKFSPNASAIRAAGFQLRTHSSAIFRRQVRPTSPIAPAFQKNDVVPGVVDVAVSLAKSNLSETALAMQRQARFIHRNDLRLQGPIPIGFRNLDQAAQQRRTDTLPARR